MSYFSKTQQIKEYIKRIDSAWYENFADFITKIEGKEGFSELFIALNPNVSIKTMLQNPKLFSCLELFSSNPNMTSQILGALSSVAWNYPMLAPEFQFTKKFILDNIDRNFCWESISRSKYVTMSDIELFSQIPWDYKGVSCNPNLTIYYVKKFYSQKKELDWFEISKHPNFTMETIISDKQLPWNPKGMTLNPNINFQMVKSNPFTKWDYTLLSSNPNIKIEDVRRNLRLPWSWTNLSGNPNLTIPFIRRFIDKEWNWNMLSSNPAFTFKMIRENQDLPWDMKGISLNPNITFNNVLKNPKLNWDYMNLCSNTFEKEKDNFYHYHLRYYFLATKIQRFWRKQSNNLNCAIGRKVSSSRYDTLMREHEEMYGFTETCTNDDGINMVQNAAYC